MNVRRGWNALDFYKRVFSAVEVVSLARDGGVLAHAELKIREAVIMLREQYPEYGFLSPESLGGTGCEILVRWLDGLERDGKRSLRAWRGLPKSAPGGARLRRGR
jgi:uncharacterized glyoxalase superfamily protein PhnB